MKQRYYPLWLSLTMIVIFIVQLLSDSFTDLLILNESSWFQPWRFVTSIFLHGSLAHLILNLFALLLFGLILEKFIGSKRFLIVFLVTGILANLIAVNFYNSSLGASGAIFGVIGALIVIRPMLPIWAFGLPMPMFVAGMIWAGADILGAYGFLAGNPIDNTGNIAHLSGMFFGLVFGFLFRKLVDRRVKKHNVSIDEHEVRLWEDRYMKH